MFDLLPEWAQPVADYIIHTGLKYTLIIASFSVVISVVVGVLLGTLLTIKFLPLQAAIRLYIEVWRGLPIIVTIPREQHEAAAALGFGWVGRHAYVILPQSFRRLIPPLVGLCVGVIQNSTLASIIGVPEVLEAAQRQTNALAVPTVDPATLEISGGDSHAFEIYMAVFILFFVISFPLTRLAAFLERRLV